MSDGMTDKRSQPDEPTAWTDKHEAAARKAMRERNERLAADLQAEDADRASLRAGIAAATAEVAKRGNQLHPKVAAMREGKAVDPARLEALRLAIQTGVSAVYALEVAERFLAFLDPASIVPRVREGLKADLATEPGTFTPAAEPELPPYLAAEVGDVVHVVGHYILTNGDYVVSEIDNGAPDGVRVCVNCRKYGDHWVADERITSIVRKANAPG